MKILIQSNDGTARNEIDVDAYGPVGTSLFSLRTVLELVTRGILAVHRAETNKAIAACAMQEEEALS